MTLTLVNPVENLDLENASSDSDIASAATESEAVEQEMGRVVLLLGGGAVQVDISSDDPSAILAIDRASGLFGEGKDLAGAVVDLIAHLRLSMMDLAAHEAHLTIEMGDELARLRLLFAE